MKRKLLAILTSVLLLCSMLPLGAVGVSAATSGTTGDCTWTLDGTHLTISGNGEMENYDYRNDATPWGSSITSIIIEDGVTSIGNDAFYKCTSLTSVAIPDSVTTIGDYAFNYCTSLTSVTIPDSVTSIGYSAFYNTGCYNTFSNWEEDVLYIGKHLIDTNTSLSGSYSIKAGTLTIGGGAFRFCTSLTSVTIPDSVTTIGVGAFSHCTYLTSMTIPDSVTTIGKSAFSYCSKLTSVTIPDSVTTIGDDAFYWCESLTSVTIPDSVTSIGEYAFCDCTSLTSVTIPDSVTSIGYVAFCGCASLTSVTIPDSVTTIGDYAFYDCTSLTSIKVDENNPNYCSADGVLFTKDKTTLIQCPGGKTGAYSIPDSVTSIGESAFSNCDSLTSVTIGDSVTSIGWDAFRDCTSLTSVTIGDSVTSIGERAFYNCASLTSMTIGDSVTSIGDDAFSWCDSLTDVYYGGSEEDKANIAISANNYYLLNATWHYNSINPKDQYDATVGHSVMDTENGNGLAFRFKLAANGVATKNVNTVDLTNATIDYLGNEVKLIGMGTMLTNDATVGSGAFTLDDVNGIDVLDIPTVYMQEVTDTSCAFATRLIDIPDTALDWVIYARPYYIIEVEGEEIVVYGDVDSATCAQYM